MYKYGDFCCPFANVYCENQNPWQGERQFFWDFTNRSLREWWVDNFFLGKNGAGGGNPWVDGCFSDDVDGLPQEHGQAIARMGYSSTQTHALQVATQQTWHVLPLSRGSTEYLGSTAKYSTRGYITF